MDPVTYRPPSWTLPPRERAQLRSIVVDALSELEPVAVTHDSPGDIARKLRDGFAVREQYREQLVDFGEATATEPLRDTVFAALVLRPRGERSSDGANRYGDVRVTWSPRLLERATISPVLSGGPGEWEQSGGGLRAGTIADLPDVLVDTLVALHGDEPYGGAWGRPDGRIERALAAPPDVARRSVRRMLTSERYRTMPAEVLLRGATPTRDAIESVAILDRPPPSWWSSPGAVHPTDEELRTQRDSIRTWASAKRVPLTDELSERDSTAGSVAPPATDGAPVT